MKFAVVAVFLLSVTCACAHENPVAFGRQFNLPVGIYCADKPGARYDACAKLVQAAVSEINYAAGRRLYVYGVAEGAIPVMFADDLGKKLGFTGGRVLGYTLPVLTPSGCIYEAAIFLESALLEGWDAPWAQTVTTHEMLHALGMEHTPDGIMTADVTNRQHSQHMSPKDGERLRANYQK